MMNIDKRMLICDVIRILRYSKIVNRCSILKWGND